MELTNAPLLIPTVQSHFSGITKSKAGLKITIPAECNAMIGTLGDLQARLSRAQPYVGNRTRGSLTHLRWNLPYGNLKVLFFKSP